MDEFQAIGGCGIVMDVNTGEVLAMVSLPDYDANDFRNAPADDRFNRAVTGMYEPGSTFKLQTASMALDDGVVHIWDEFDAAHDIHIGRFTITDFEGKHRWLYLPEVLAYSSNLGAAHIGAGRWCGTAARLAEERWACSAASGIELPEAGHADHPAGRGLEGDRDDDRRRSATASRSRRCMWCAGTAAVATGVLRAPDHPRRCDAGRRSRTACR